MIELRAGDDQIDLDPARGGRAVSWIADGAQLLTGEPENPFGHGCYPMAPWAGRLRGNQIDTAATTVAFAPTMGDWAIHGTALHQPWQIVDVTGTAATLRCELAEPWPWPGSVIAQWRLSAGSLTTMLRIEAAVDPFPASLGWHPWFAKRLDGGEPAQVSLPGARMLERGADHLPTDRLVDPTPGPHDDAFALPKGRALIRWPGRLALECRSDHQWFVLYDEPADTVCLEPQTAPPDALRPGAIAPAAVVRPERPLSLTTHWTWRPDPAAR